MYIHNITIYSEDYTYSVFLLSKNNQEFLKEIRFHASTKFSFPKTSFLTNIQLSFTRF